jgi:uncharacterized protein (TIGR02687 family)
MNPSKIQSALEKAFAQRRIVFWYDETAEWWPECDAVNIPAVEKISVHKNEFAVKHRITREAPQQKFLLYFRGQKRPLDKDNWLLDQLMAHGPAFSPDRASLALIDAELPPDFKPLTEQHLEFFRSNDRVERLKEWLTPTDTERQVRLKMIAVVCRTEPTVEAILLTLLADLAREKTDRSAPLDKFALTDAWWKELGTHFGYLPAAPALLDFVLCLFRAVAPLGGSSTLDTRQALVFLNRWKDSEEHREAFEILSERADRLLNISAALNQVEDVRPLLPCDAYRRIDLKILAGLRDGLVHSSLSPAEVRQRVDAREHLHWARHDPVIKALYRSLAVAADLIDALPKLDLTIDSFDAGLEKYAATWWQIDQLYRRFIFHFTASGQVPLLEQLADRIEGLYVNEYLSRLAQHWQEWLDRCSTWFSTTVPRQRDFFTRFLQPQLHDGRKVFVIVSDALRYEAGRALMDRILTEDRWLAEVKSVLGALPSFTQLGMAALLPHKSLEFDPRGQTILADGISTVGTKARGSILAASLGGRAAAISAEDFLALNSKTEGRDLAKANDVVFIYHNHIDAVGDERSTEHKTCAAVEEALEEIIRILKKAAAMNVSHFLITSDHGFLYQHQPVAESDFLPIAQPAGTLKYDRRFIVAPSIPEDPRLNRFTSTQLGLEGNLQVSFPKGIQRLRQQGSGSRYVHGGHSLQEVVLPVLEVKKERASDVGRVDVDIVRSGQQITTGQITITFLQNEPIGEKCLSRELRAGFFSKSGVQLSDTKTLKFDSAAEDARQRERREQFVFAREADQFNQQEILLRLDEPIPGTTQFALYREFTFKLRRAFESDFE